MSSLRKESNVYFFTATNLNWNKLLEDDECGEQESGGTIGSDN